MAMLNNQMVSKECKELCVRHKVKQRKGAEQI